MDVVPTVEQSEPLRAQLAHLHGSQIGIYRKEDQKQGGAQA